MNRSEAREGSYACAAAFALNPKTVGGRAFISWMPQAGSQRRPRMCESRGSGLGYWRLHPFPFSFPFPHFPTFPAALELHASDMGCMDGRRGGVRGHTACVLLPFAFCFCGTLLCGKAASARKLIAGLERTEKSYRRAKNKLGNQ